MMLLSYRSPRVLIETGITIPQLYEWNATENPDYPLFRFHDGQMVKDVTYASAKKTILRVARHVQSFAGKTDRVSIAILGNTDSITYTLTSVGILRAGHILFPISVRNGLAAVIDLVRRTKCTHILVSEDEHMSILAKDTAQAVPGVTLHPILTYEQLLAEEARSGAVNPGDVPVVEYKLDDVAMILHSSGSTNHPNPIHWTHKRMVSRGTTPWYGEVDLMGSTIACHGTPMFHAHGVSMYSTAVTTGVIIGVFPPSSPPKVPTTENVFEGSIAISADYIVTAPSFVEQWARDPNKVDHMKRVKGIMFGGGELDHKVGDMLASQGVNLIIVYGCTEVGAIANVISANPGKDWAYFAITPWIQTVEVDAGDGKYEIIVLSPPDCPLALVNTKINGIDAYATNDLVVPHPTRPGLWKLYGRRDDQLVLSNGEKTNPLPLERIISEDPRIHDCIVFGHRKVQNGVLVEPMPKFAVDPHDKAKLAEFRNAIWQTIKRANTFAPQHSRIFKEMILVASPTKPFDYNAKGNVRRNPILQRYVEEIEEIYAQVEQSAQSDFVSPSTWDTPSTIEFVRTVMHKILLRPVADDADIFRSGCDSLQATYIRNTILRILRESAPSAAGRLPMDVVFKAPTISTLSKAILQVISNTDDPDTHAVSSQDLVKMANALSSDLPGRPSPLRQREDGKDIVLITGTTGGFGCDVLEHLLRDDDIGTVYAFNRRGAQVLAKQQARFRERGLEEWLLDLPKFRMIEMDLHVPGFGLEPDVLEEIRNSVTHIMHNAWQVDFNLTLTSYEVDLKAVRNLMELSLSSPYVSPPRVQFTSSVGIYRDSLIEPPILELPSDPAFALGTGYSEAKWIAEQALRNASENFGLPICIVRLGQVCGDRQGHWNEKEWFPALVKSGIFTRCLPDVEGTISFIPSYPAARAFVEMRKSPSTILHLVHPRPIPWHTIIAPLAQEVGVSLVPYADWLTSLQRCGEEESTTAGDLRQNPALVLLRFFSSWQTRRPVSTLRFSTDKATGSSPTLSGMNELEGETAVRWMNEWRKTGFL